MKKQITRRGFLKGAGLVLAMTATPAGVQLLNVSQSLAADQDFRPHAFIEIAPDDTFTVWVGQTELGQGTHTGIAMILADEVGADWDRVQVKMAPAGKAFLDPLYKMQFTGGSTSIRHRWDLFRQVGAAAREMLIQAAAQKWGVKPSECRAENGKVTGKGGKSLSFGQLAAKAATLPVPNKPRPKPARDYTIIGTKRDRLDIPGKVAGSTVFGYDFKLPGMLLATLARPPAYGAKPKSFNADAAKAVKGVVAVIPLGDKVAVCATDTWAAMAGREALDIKWSPGTLPELDNANLDKWYQDYLAKPGVVAHKTGDAPAALGKAAKKLKAAYKFPYLAHATLEPMNCTALVEKDRCRIWAPTQGQTPAQMAGAKVTKLPMDKIEVMTLYAGGGFGRRVEFDVVVEAVLLSKITKRPVKVVWAREDDFKNDFYRPGAACSVEGGLDAKGNLVSWVHKIATPSIMSRLMPQAVKKGVDHTSVEGVDNMDYVLPNRLVEFMMVKLPIPVGFWRSVGNSFNPFVVECFLDELAAAAGKDPLEFRLNLLKKGSRARDTLEFLAQKANWGSPVPAGRGRGLAVRSCFGSSAGHVAEVSVDPKSGTVKVHKLVCVIDCGIAVFPDAVKTQMQGGAIMALSAAFKERVEFAGGGVQTANYDDYPLLSMAEVPEIEVHIAKSRHKVGGVGELPIPTVAPAVANAIFDACGVRLRELPFDTGKLKKG